MKKIIKSRYQSVLDSKGNTSTNFRDEITLFFQR